MARAKKKEALSLEEKLEQALVPMDEWPYGVPENWCWTRLKNVTYHISDGLHNLPKDAGKGIPLLSATNIRDSQINFKNITRYITEEEWVQENKRTKVMVGDVLLTIVASIGRTAIIENDIKFALQRSVAVIKPIYNGKYIKYFLDSPYIQSFMLKNAKGTAQKGFYLKSVEELYIAFPPISEQQRIVEQIESLFCKLDEGKEKTQEVISNLEVQKQRILQDGFEGKLTKNWRKDKGINFDSWQQCFLKDVCTQMKAGGDKPNDFIEHFDNEHQIPVVANGVTNEGIIGYTSEAKYKAGTVTISGRGTIGFSINRKYDFYPVVRLIVLCPKTEIINAQFLKYAFDAYPEKGTGSSIPQLTVPSIKDKEIPIPSLEEQNEIVSIIEKVINRYDDSIKSSKDVVENIDSIKKSILAKVFRGELGTNNPSEESAIELLKQIIKGKE